MDSHTSRHTAKTRLLTQDEHLGLLGLEALTDTSDFHSATRLIDWQASIFEGNQTQREEGKPSSAASVPQSRRAWPFRL